MYSLSVGRSMGLALFFAFYPLLATASEAGATSSSAGAGTVGFSTTSNPVAMDANGADWKQSASSEVRHVAHWIVASGDNGGKPYVIIDKVNARVFVFDVAGTLRGADAALLGMARGDGTVKDIGEQKLAAIRPQDRTTPAGRFVASLDRDLKGREILWIDYDNALALHQVAKGQPSEQRAQRLASATSDDNRISFGCINVPVEFYENVVSPAFKNTEGIVYILPEMSTARELFRSYDGQTESRQDVP